MSLTAHFPGETAISDEELAALRNRLREAEETLAAIRNGEVDAVVVGGGAGQRVYSLESADRPYRALIEQMLDGAITVSSDGAILYCNRRFAALVGVGAEHIMGAPLNRFLSESGTSLWRSLCHDARGQRTSGEAFVLDFRGGETPVNVSCARVILDELSEPVVCVVVSDLTATHRRSLELHATNQRLANEINERHKAEESLQLALDAAGMGSWDLDLATGTAHRSQRHDEIFGHDRLLRPWGLADALQQFIPEDAGRVSQAFKDAETSGVIEIEARITRAQDGQQRWLRISGRTFYDADARPTHIAGVVADITDRRAVEERLRQAQKIEAIGQLTGGIAHDFNNLLQVIAGGLQLVSRGVDDSERRERVLMGMRRAVERGASLSRQLLAFSRSKALNPSPIALQRQIEGMHELLERSLRGDVAVLTEFAPDLWPVEVDPGELELVMLNLAVNARDAMPDGGTITIGGHNIVDPDQTLRGDYVQLDVSDTGTGMPPEVLAHAFEPFFTTKEVGKGSGLGLAQTHGFVQASGGSVRIWSVMGVGTTVSLYLPRSHKVPVTSPEVAIEVREGVKQKDRLGHVLLVEDDDEVAALTSEMINELGYKTTRVATADAALGALANGRPIDLVFSDVMMPGTMNGIELAAEIHRRRPDLKVVLTSGYAESAKRASNARDVKVLEKPFSLEDLRTAFIGCGRAG